MNGCKSVRRLVLGILLISFFITTIPMSVITTHAATTEFAGGSGTETDPYLIETKAHLNNVRYHLNAHYKMIDDIVFLETDFQKGGQYYTNGRGWSPIGFDDYDPFTGVFDGDGHTIEGLQLTRYGGTRYAGLFGWCNGKIKNLGVVDSVITIKAQSSYEYVYAGGIAGCAGADSEITNCWSAGSVMAHTNDAVSYSRAYAGGIAGVAQDATIINACYNIADIRADAPGYACSSFAGGLVGAFSDAGTIENTYIRNSYNAGNVVSDGDTGGVVGRMWQGTVEQCHNVGSVSGEYRGAITGYTSSKGVVKNNYYLNNVADAVGNKTNNSMNAKCTLEQMAKQDTYTEFDFVNVWEFSECNSYQYPILKNIKFISVAVGLCPGDSTGQYKHQYSLVNERVPTCTMDGSYTYICDYCGHKYDEEIAALGHYFDCYISDNNATCVTDGTKTATCHRCDAKDTLLDIGSQGHKDRNMDYLCDGCSVAIPHDCIDENGDYFCDLCHQKCSSEEEYLPGDITGDGKVNMGDVAKLYAHIRATSTLTEETGLNRCDVSGDGKVNMGDVAKLYAHIKGTNTLY